MTMVHRKAKKEVCEQKPFEVLRRITERWDKTRTQHFRHTHPHDQKIKKAMMREHPIPDKRKRCECNGDVENRMYCKPTNGQCQNIRIKNTYSLFTK
jgi:hypothetical protein